MWTAPSRESFVGNYNHCQSFYERYTAFRMAMLMADVPVDERFVFCTNRVEEIIEPISELGELPDVFICANDFIAGDLIRGLFSIGKTVPDDVLILGFDNSPESRIIRPSLSTVHIHTQVMAIAAISLSTVHIHTQVMAIAAMHLLISRRNVPSMDSRIVHTETELIFRDSTRLH